MNFFTSKVAFFKIAEYSTLNYVFCKKQLKAVLEKSVPKSYARSIQKYENESIFY